MVIEIVVVTMVIIVEMGTILW